MSKKTDFFKTAKTAWTMTMAMLVPGALLMAAPLATSHKAMDQSTMITTTCTRCHSLKRVCAKLGSTPQAWQSTLTRMQAKGSGVSDERNMALAQFLSATTAQDADFCR